jgi:hypothetical protein
MKNHINSFIKYIPLLILTLSFNPIFAQSDNNAYVFEDSVDYAGIRDSEDITSNATKSAYQFFDDPASSNGISVEAWVYLIEENPGVKMSLVNRSFNDGYESFHLYIEDRVVYFSIHNDAGEVNTIEQPLIPAFSWIHLAGTYDGQELKLYYGGELVQALPLPVSNIPTAAPDLEEGGFFIGTSDDDDRYVLIDEVRIWDYALGENNINGSGGNGNPSENYPQSIAEHLNGRWSFTEFSYAGDGTKYLEDLSGYNNHLIVYDIVDIVNSKHPPFFVVNSTDDLPDLLPGDGSAKAENGFVTLRSAIEESNALPGYQIIYFYIPGSPPFIIQPLSPLPEITGQVFLKATSQSGYTDTPLVEVNGSFGGLILSGGSSTVKGLAITGSTSHGIVINGNNNLLSDNVIDSHGGAGVFVESGDYNSILYNSIYANTGLGIQLNGSENEGQKYPQLNLLYAWKDETDPSGKPTESSFLPILLLRTERENAI